jgi:hypothetical protein
MRIRGSNKLKVSIFSAALFIVLMVSPLPLDAQANIKTDTKTEEITLSWGEFFLVRALSPFKYGFRGRLKLVTITFKDASSQSAFLQVLSLVNYYTKTHFPANTVGDEIREVMLHLEWCNLSIDMTSIPPGCPYNYPKHLVQIMTEGTPRERIIGALIVRGFISYKHKKDYSMFQPTTISKALAQWQSNDVPHLLALKALGELRKASEEQKDKIAEKTYIRKILEGFRSYADSDVYKKTEARAKELKMRIHSR